MYLCAWYWAIQTVTTVGYGDVPTVSVHEKMFKLVAMVIGVIVFSDFIGSLTLDMGSNESNESNESKYKQRIEYIRNKYNLNAKSVLQLEKII
mmetsp:Transcript_54048/g.45470  ORF Transcript_54048/g.45470 Transcript_54048/m.45470 type:complete len:93 (+) Transcript_54048:188-466(+)